MNKLIFQNISFNLKLTWPLHIEKFKPFMVKHDAKIFVVIFSQVDIMTLSVTITSSSKAVIDNFDYLMIIISRSFCLVGLNNIISNILLDEQLVYVRRSIEYKSLNGHAKCVIKREQIFFNIIKFVTNYNSLKKWLDPYFYSFLIKADALSEFLFLASNLDQYAESYFKPIGKKKLAMDVKFNYLFFEFKKKYPELWKMIFFKKNIFKNKMSKLYYSIPTHYCTF